MVCGDAPGIKRASGFADRLPGALSLAGKSQKVMAGRGSFPSPESPPKAARLCREGGKGSWKGAGAADNRELPLQWGAGLPRLPGKREKEDRSAQSNQSS